METDTIAEQPAPAPVSPATEVPAAEFTPTEAPTAEVTPTKAPPAEAQPAEVTPATAPENVSPPVIEGDPVAGGTLTSTGGQWNGAGWVKYTWIVDGVTVQAADHTVGQADVLHIAPSMAGKSVQLTVLASLEAQGPGTSWLPRR